MKTDIDTVHSDKCTDIQTEKNTESVTDMQHIERPKRHIDINEHARQTRRLTDVQKDTQTETVFALLLLAF
jgi:hypothetical protein